MMLPYFRLVDVERPRMATVIARVVPLAPLMVTSQNPGNESFNRILPALFQAWGLAAPGLLNFFNILDHLSVMAMSTENINNNARIKNVGKWAKAMVDPSAEAVIAPSLMPRPTCTATIVHSYDISYADTVNGYVTAVVLPDPKHHYLQTSTGSYPSSGTANLTLKSIEAEIPAGENTLSKGLFQIFDNGVGGTEGLVHVLDDGSVVHPSLAGQGLIPFQILTGESVLVTLYSGDGGYFNVQGITAVGAVSGLFGARYYAPGANTHQTATTMADIAYIRVQRCDSAATPISLDSDQSLIITISADGVVPSSANSYMASVVKSELLQQGSVSHCSMVGAQMLVTNLASPYDAGGEIVMCRTGQSILTAPTTADLMQDIKSLPEKTRWRSGPLLNGGFAWHMHDDRESYEPRPIDSRHSDNALIAAIKMASNQGQVRVNITSKWNFYSRAQVLQRKVGHAWCDEASKTLELLARRPAVSENPLHPALIAAAGSAIDAAIKFYMAYKPFIDPLAAHVASGAANAIAKKLGKKPPPKKVAKKRKN